MLLFPKTYLANSKKQRPLTGLYEKPETNLWTLAIKWKAQNLGTEKYTCSPLKRKKSELLKSEPEPPQREDNVQVTLQGPSFAVGKKWLYPTDSLTSAILKVYLVISK